MGLIKTAIMTGGGIYAVNKLAKAAENRHNSKSNNGNQYPPRDNSNYSNKQWGPPGPPPERDYYSADEQPQPQLYAPNSQNRGSGSYATPSQRDYSPADYANDKLEYDEDGWQVPRGDRVANGPPPYATQQGCVPPPTRAYKYDDQSQSQRQVRGGRGARLEGLANMAMGFIENGGNGNGKKGSKDSLKEFFGK